MKKSTLFTTLFLLTCLYSFANQTKSIVSGIVTSTDGKPIEFVSVFIEKSQQSTMTNEKGEYALELSSGNHQLHFYSFNYLKKEQTISLSVGEEKRLNVVLKENENLLSEVVINGKTKKKEIETKGFTVNVIETKKIAVQSIQTNELLDRTAGVRIRQDGGMGSHVNYNINGMSGEAIKVFIDGIPTSNYGPTFSLNSIPPALIERIEVYKGVVPGHLSEDALGGAINIILKQHQEKTLSSSYSYGSFNTHQWNASGSYRGKNGLSFDGSAFYNYSDNDYKVWGKDIYFRSYDGTITESNGKKVKRFHDDYESFGGKFDIGFTNVRWADQFLVGAVLSSGYHEVQNGATMKVVYGNKHNKRKSNVVTLLYSKKDLFTEGLSLKVNASHSYLNRQMIDSINIMYDWTGGPIIDPRDGSYVRYTTGGETSKEQSAEINKDHTNMVRANLAYQISKKHALYANYIVNSFERKISDKFQPIALQKLRNTRDLQKSILSLTYESLWFSDRLRTNIFYKYYFQKAISNEAKQSGTDFLVDKIESKLNNNGYGLTISYTLFPNLYLLGSVEKAIRMPSPDEVFGNATGDILTLASFSLKPEESTNVNIGFNFGTYSIKKHSFGLNASLFFRDTKNMIRKMDVGSSDVYTQFQNLQSVETKGIDAELNYSYDDKLDFRFNVSKFDVLFNTKYDEFGHAYNYYRMQICNEPSFKFNANLSYYIHNLLQKGSSISLHYNINHVNRFLRSWSNVGSKNQDTIPAQWPMDLGLTYTFPKNKLVLSIDAKNILNQQVFDNFGLQKPGRAFYAKITYHIL